MHPTLENSRETDYTVEFHSYGPWTPLIGFLNDKISGSVQALAFYTRI